MNGFKQAQNELQTLDRYIAECERRIRDLQNSRYVYSKGDPHLELRNYTDRLKNLKARRDAVEKASDEHASTPLGRYLLTLAPNRRAKAEEALNVYVRVDGEPMRRYELVERKVAEGYRVRTVSEAKREAGYAVSGVKDSRILVSPNGIHSGYWEEKAITATAMSYAEYLTKDTTG